MEVLGQGQEFGIAPHIRRTLANSLACERCAYGVVVVANFQGGEAIVADGTGLVSPGLTAFAAAQFVSGHSYSFLASSWGRARKRVPKTGNLFPGYKEKRLRD